jgi:ABC-type phosphonate transport system ATPase subunit
MADDLTPSTGTLKTYRHDIHFQKRGGVVRIAFVGKGGSGKTTLSALFSRHLARSGATGNYN